MSEQDLKIEQYLNGELSATEAAEVEQKAAQDETFAAELALQKEMRLFFERRNPVLEAELKNLGEAFFLETPAKKNQSKLIFFVVALLLCGLIAGVLFFLQKENKTTAPIIAPQKVAPKSETLPPNDTLKKTLNNTPPPQSLPQPTEKSAAKKVAPPIAEAETDAFLANEFLEGLIKQNIRSEGEMLNLVFPAASQVFYNKMGQIDFKMQGNTSLKISSFEVLIYNNKPTHFQKNYPVFKTSFAQNLSASSFDFSAKLNLETGLYYLIIKEKDELEMLHISKFLVK